MGAQLSKLSAGWHGTSSHFKGRTPRNCRVLSRAAPAAAECAAHKQAPAAAWSLQHTPATGANLHSHLQLER